jgi:DNA-binding IscR family transcriptional regulator
MKGRIVKLTRSQYAIHALGWMFERPIFKSADFVRVSHIPKPTAARILGVLKSEGILLAIEEGRGRKPTVLAYRDLLNIAEGYDAF